MATWPDPQPGLVVRYSYLWRREALAGRDEASKDRPCAIVIAIDEGPAYRRVYVLPITHGKPAEDKDGIEIPSQTRKRLEPVRLLLKRSFNLSL